MSKRFYNPNKPATRLSYPKFHALKERQMNEIKIHNYDTDNQPTETEQTWTTAQLTQDFQVLSFSAPYVSVIRRSDGQGGTLEFKHSPRVYFNWRPSK